MKRHVSFKTGLFESKQPRPHFINERCFDEDLATWLISQIRTSPFLVSEPIQEDYGWGFWARLGNESYWMALGIMDESIGSAVAEWLITVAYDMEFNPLRRWWSRPNVDHLRSLCTLIDQALHAEPKITEIQWWRDEPFRDLASAHPA